MLNHEIVNKFLDTYNTSKSGCEGFEAYVDFVHEALKEEIDTLPEDLKTELTDAMRACEQHTDYSLAANWA